VTKARLGRATIVEFSSGDETCFAPAREGVPLGDLMTKKRKVKVDGEEFDVELEKVDGVWAVTVGSKKFTIEVSGGKDDRKVRGNANAADEASVRERYPPPFRVRSSRLQSNSE